MEVDQTVYWLCEQNRNLCNGSNYEKCISKKDDAKDSREST